MVISLRFPKVQNKVVSYITPILSKNLNAKVAVKRVDIDFFKTVVLEGVHIEDQEQDTLIYADRLSATIGLFSFFDKNIQLNQIKLEGAKAKLSRLGADTAFNFQFIIDQFQPPNTKKEENTSPWRFNIGAVLIENSSIDFLDEQTASHLEAQIPYLNVVANQLDFIEQSIDLEQIKLGGATINYQSLVAKSKAHSKDTLALSPLQFPDIGWDLKVNQLELVDNTILFDNQNVAPRNKEGIDFQHVEVSGLIVLIEDLEWGSNNIQGTIDRFGFQEKNGFELQNLQANIIADTNQILIKNLAIQTPYSRLANTTKLTFDELEDLMDFGDKVKFESDFDNVNIAFKDLQQFAPAINQIQQLNTNLNQQLFLDGQIKGTANDLTINNLNFNIGKAVDLKVNATLKNIMNIEEAKFDVRLEKLTTSYESIKKLTDSLTIPKGLEEFGQFTLSGHAIGQLVDLEVSDFFLQTESNTNIKADAILAGLPKKENVRFDLNIQSLETNVEDWKGFFKNTPPPILDSLGAIQFAGKIEGNVYRFELVGDVNTSIGKLESDLMIHFTPDYQSGDYSGDLRLINFELNKAFSENAALGTASLQVKGQGSGFNLDSLVADAQVIIDSIDYNDYTYRNIEIDGEMTQRNFDGKINLDDENAKLTFNGKANFKDSIPNFVFVLELDTLNLLPLNFTEKPLSIQLKADIDFSGKDFNSIDGRSVISNFKINNEIDTYAEDSLMITATRPRSDSVKLSWQSDFLKAQIDGDFDIVKLSKVTLNYINDFFPLDNLLDTITRANVASVINDQQSFTFNIQITDPTPLTLLFLPKLTLLEDGLIQGEFNRQKQKLEIEAIIDNLEFGNIYTDQLIFNVNGSEEKLKANLALLQVEAGGLYAPLAIFDTNLGEDSLRFQVTVADDTLGSKLALKGIAYDAIQWYEIKLTDRLFLNGEEWAVAANNEVYFLNNYLFVNNLKIRDGRHQIAIQSEGFPQKAVATPPINLSFNDFEIAEITNFLAINQNRVKGLINGDFTLKEPFGNAHYVSDLKVNDLVLNGEKVGQFYLDSEQAEGSKIINLVAGLKGEKNNLEIGGQYRIDQRNFDIQGDIEEMELRLLDPFTINIISKSKGRASGKFTLGGTPLQPDLKGQLNLKEASTKIDFLGARILIPEHTIGFNNKEITLGMVTVKDVDNQTGTLTGNIYHNFFDDFLLDLKFQTNSFQVMNTNATNNPLFFGQLYVDADVYINGSLELPYIEVNARTLPNSVFNLQPLVESEQISRDDYIIFTTPEKYAEEGEETGVSKYELSNVFNVDLLMNLDVTPDALLKIIIDPLTGDQVEGRGRSNMTIALSPAGDMRILGDFVIEEGEYNFSYQNLVKKNFDIQSGSRVSFVGDPLKAMFNITATYDVKTTTYELIRNETNLDNSAESNAARRRTDVQALLYLNGLFTKPEIKFDIRLPEGIGNNVNSTVSRKLNDLRNDPDEMNKQVFALLLFNSFLATENAGESIAGAGQNIALSSVSKLLSNQLNDIAGKYFKGLELSFDFASYQSNFEDAAGPAVELGVGLSQKLFNDRITIKADADFNLANQSTTAGSNVAGDFVLEYQLTESGSYLLRVFRLSDFDILTDQNTARTGVGISFRKAFGNVLKNKK